MMIMVYQIQGMSNQHDYGPLKGFLLAMPCTEDPSEKVTYDFKYCVKYESS